MLTRMLIAVRVGVSLVTLAVVSSVEAGSCEPLVATRRGAPAAPTSLRLIADANDRRSNHRPESGIALADGSARSYFDVLSARSDCSVAYHLRTEAQLKGLETLKSGMSRRGEMRLPITYDAAMDAALVRIDPRTGSTDGEHKRLPIATRSASILLTWDLRFDEGYKWVREGYLRHHKAFQIASSSGAVANGRWLEFRTNYKNATLAGSGVAELYLHLDGTKWYGPGTHRGPQESPEPRRGRFFIEANRWTRVWVWIQDIDKLVSYVTIWVADEERDPVQLYDRLAVIPPPFGLTTFWLEYDTSQEDAENSIEDAANGMMRSWNRNLVMLTNVPASDVGGLLQRP